MNTEIPPGVDMFYDDPITMFRTESGHAQIDSVLVNEKTQVFINITPKKGKEYRVRLDSGVVQYHSSWDLARRFLLERTKARIVRISEELRCEEATIAVLGKRVMPDCFIDSRTESVDKKEKKGRGQRP